MALDFHDLHSDHVGEIRRLRALRIHLAFRGRRRAEERRRTNDFVRFHLAELRRLRAARPGETL